MRIAFVGSREFIDKDFVQSKVYDYIVNDRVSCFISGGARGVDTWAEEVSNNFGIGKRIFEPNWDEYGKKAGYLRNIEIVEAADKLIAFWDGKSKGTRNTIDLAIKKGIPIDIYIRS